MLGAIWNSNKYSYKRNWTLISTFLFLSTKEWMNTAFLGIFILMAPSYLNNIAKELQINIFMKEDIIQMILYKLKVISKMRQYPSVSYLFSNVCVPNSLTRLCGIIYDWDCFPLSHNYALRIDKKQCTIRELCAVYLFFYIYIQISKSKQNCSLFCGWNQEMSIHSIFSILWFIPKQATNITSYE